MTSWSITWWICLLLLVKYQAMCWLKSWPLQLVKKSRQAASNLSMIGSNWGSGIQIRQLVRCGNTENFVQPSISVDSLYAMYVREHHHSNHRRSTKCMHLSKGTNYWRFSDDSTAHECLILHLGQYPFLSPSIVKYDLWAVQSCGLDFIFRVKAFCILLQYRE